MTKLAIEYVPRGLVVPPWDHNLLVPYEQAEAIVRSGRVRTQPVVAPSDILVGEDFEPLFDDSLLGLIRHLCFHGGRGGAKSWAAILAAVLRMRRYRGYRVANVRQHQVSLDQSMHAVYRGTIQRLHLEDEFKVTDSSILHLGTKAEAIFKGIGVNTDNIRSLEDVDLCIVEEATQLTKKGIDTLVPTIRAQRAQFIWLWNPSDEGPQAVDNRFRTGADFDDTLVREVNFNTSNPHWYYTSLVGEERQQRRNEGEHSHIWLGQYPQASSALVMRPEQWSVGYCDVPHWAEPRYGMDFGFNPDPTVYLKCYVIEPETADDLGVIYISDCVAEQDVTTADLPGFLGRIHNPGYLINCDNSEPRTIADIQAAGYAAEGAPKGPGSIKAGLKFIKGYHVRISPDCDPMLVNEFRNYRHKVDRATGKPLPDFSPTGHDHGFDALRYAIWDYVRLTNEGVDYI